MNKIRLLISSKFSQVSLMRKRIIVFFFKYDLYKHVDIRGHSNENVMQNIYLYCELKCKY